MKTVTMKTVNNEKSETTEYDKIDSYFATNIRTVNLKYCFQKH